MTAQEKLLKQYKKSYELLLKRIADKTAAGSMAVFEKRLLKELQKLIKELDKAAVEQLPGLVGSAYTSAWQEAANILGRAGISSMLGGGINTRAMDMIAQNAVDMLVQANHYFGRHTQDRLRQIGLEAIAEKLSAGETVQQARKRIIETLTAEGLQTAVGKTGRPMRLESYAKLIARTTTREATNTATMDATTQYGHDLVKFSTHYPTCAVCFPLQGRVFSISGNDKRFPALSEVPGFDHGFKTVHPNCRHVLVPIVWGLCSPEEQAKYLADANKPVKGDARDHAEVATYNDAQRKNRELWADRRQWGRYKAVLGDYAPKTLAGFRRIKNADGDSWGILQAQYKGMGYYNQAVYNEPPITPVVTEIAEKAGMDIVGLDKRIKSIESYLDKIARNYSPEQNIYDINDNIRYTYVANGDSLVDKTNKSIDMLKQSGYNMVTIKNYWLISERSYNGINSTWRDTNGQLFEVQFHTPESFEMKDVKTHGIYERFRKLDSTSEEAIELEKQAMELSKGLRVPANIERVKTK